MAPMGPGRSAKQPEAYVKEVAILHVTCIEKLPDEKANRAGACEILLSVRARNRRVSGTDLCLILFVLIYSRRSWRRGRIWSGTPPSATVRHSTSKLPQ